MIYALLTGKISYFIPVRRRKKECLYSFYWGMGHLWGMLEKLVHSSVTHLAELDSIYWYRVMRLMCQTHDTKEDKALCFLLFILYKCTSIQRASVFTGS